MTDIQEVRTLRSGVKIMRRAGDPPGLECFVPPPAIDPVAEALAAYEAGIPSPTGPEIAAARDQAMTDVIRAFRAANAGEGVE